MPVLEAPLGERVRDGGVEAFNALYQEYAPGIYDFLLRLVRDQAAAEDLTQAAFTQAFEHRSSLREPDKVRSWLWSMAHNLAMNQLSRDRRSENIEDHLELAELGRGPEDTAVAHDAAELVWLAAASLEPRQYAVLDLTVRRDLSTQEVAETLGVPVSHAAVLVHRSREALGNALRYLLVARRRERCDQLAALVPAGVRSLTPEQRSTVDHHMRRCEKCRELGERLTMPVELFGALVFVPLPARLAKLDLSRMLAAHAGTPPARPSIGTALGRRRFPGGIQGLTVVVATVVVVGTGAAVWRVQAASQKPGTQHIATAKAVATSRSAGSSAGASAQPSASGAAGASNPGGGVGAAPLFAILETRNCPAGQSCTFLGLHDTHDTVVVAKADGFAIARTTFSARKIPGVGNALTLADLEGQVAAGAVYFVDGSGTVRRMTPDGGVTTVARFPIDSAQQSISFAVSPDGKGIMAAVLTYPLFTPGATLDQSTATGPWRLQIEKAKAGGATVLLHQWQTNTNQGPNTADLFANIWLAGWDAQGPIALVGQAIGIQNSWLNNQRYFGHFARLSADGTPGASIGPVDCLPYWRPIDGRFVCTGDNTAVTTQINVVDVNGKVLWSGIAPQPNQSSLGVPGVPGDFVLSPDGIKLAMDGQVVTLASNAIQKLSPNFEPQGWLDANTLIGLIPVNGTVKHVGILRLDDPLHPEDWGFSGAYVGLVS
jgi:RNA polymerase sigma factor (sigma-70 family)